MIKRTIALAVLATLASGAAFAQSSVTLYGRLNVTAERQKFIDTKADYTLENNSSFLGLKGQEDLGGGLKAGFILESGLNPTTGTANSTFWNRQSEVNLSSAKLGMVRIGSFDAESALATADWVSMHNHDTGWSSDALYSYDSTFKQNKIAYRTPEFVKGLSLEVATAERTTSTQRPVDLAANYDLGALKIGAGYSRANDAKQFAARATYEIGAFTFGGYVQRATTEAYTTKSQNIYRLAGMYALGASEFHANVGYATKGGAANSKANQATLAYNYNLSKRTKVYGFMTRLDYTANSGVDFTSYAVGVRHLF